MDIELRLKVEGDRGAIYVFDETGKFQNKINEGAWGEPNLRIEDITKAEVSVFLPESEEPIIIDVHPSLPNDQGIGFEILAKDLGLEEITSGVWKFELRVFHNPGQANEEVFVDVVYKFFDHVIACCIEERKHKFDALDVSSDDNKKTVELDTLLANARWAACASKLEAAQRIAKFIRLQCDC